MGKLEIDLRAKVKLMRELGVLSWDGLILGPAPIPVSKMKRKKVHPLEDKRNYYEEILGRKPSDAELERLP